MSIIISLVCVLVIIALVWGLLDLTPIEAGVAKLIKLVVIGAALVYVLLLAFGHAPLIGPR